MNNPFVATEWEVDGYIVSNIEWALFDTQDDGRDEDYEDE